MRKLSFAALPFAILPLAVLLCSPQVRAADLMQTFHDAQVGDPVYSSARHALEAGQERLPQGRAALLPVISAQGGYSRNAGDANLTGSGQPYDWTTKGYTLTLSQPLFRLGNWQEYQQGKLAVAASEANFAQAAQDLILRVCQAYFDVLAAQDALDTVQAQKSAIGEQLASARHNFDVGNATVTDAHEAQSRADIADADEAVASANLDIKRAALQQIIGKPGGALAPLRGGLRLPPPQPASMNDWVGSAETQNYAVVARQLNLEIARREITRERAGHLPTVDLVVTRNHNNQNGASPILASGISNSNAVGIQINIPIFAGGSVNSKVREALALADKADSDLETARRSAAQGVRSSYLAIINGLARIKALEAAESSSTMSLDSNKLGYEIGARINIDVLNAQQQLYSTRRDLAQARYTTIMDGLRLKAAAGALVEDDVARVNMLLQN